VPASRRPLPLLVQKLDQDQDQDQDLDLVHHLGPLILFLAHARGLYEPFGCSVS